MNNKFTIKTSFTLKTSIENIWNGITNSVMTYPKPLCFNLGIPLPIKCEITREENGIGKSRKCTSDHGYIQQNITLFDKHKRLSFYMVSHSLNVYFTINNMNDDFMIEKCQSGLNQITRVTEIEIPSGYDFVIRKWLIGKSIRNVHYYVYNNIKSAQQGDAADQMS